MDPANPCRTCQCLLGGHYACSNIECPAVDCPADVQARSVGGCCMECLGASPK
ncbi:hypothetical protein DPMN_059518 [Dreissena polymorpha]|uniref:VWFC domain-containing protein n=1 Tax=Dreissena polymorpha TaxID=45954 RepID=A0A9D4C4B8_DREPO|nr:hypothetical protein DPMN_059518 [Dreissena polymorpha]